MRVEGTAQMPTKTRQTPWRAAPCPAYIRVGRDEQPSVAAHLKHVVAELDQVAVLAGVQALLDGREADGVLDGAAARVNQRRSRLSDTRQATQQQQMGERNRGALRRYTHI